MGGPEIYTIAEHAIAVMKPQYKLYSKIVVSIWKN